MHLKGVFSPIPGVLGNISIFLLLMKLQVIVACKTAKSQVSH